MKFCLIGSVWPYRSGISHIFTIVAKGLTDARDGVQIVSFCRQPPYWLYPRRTDQDNSQNPLKASAEYIIDPFASFISKNAATLARTYQPDPVMI